MAADKINQICESSPECDYDEPSGENCKCGKEMTKGELECFGVCLSCYDWSCFDEGINVTAH